VSAVLRRALRLRLTRRYRLPATTVLALAFVASSPAQLDAQRFTCEEASAVLLSADAERLDRFSAASTMLGCGNIAPGTIASALRRATPNTTADTIATILAMRTFDRRLADSIRVVALDSNQSIARRTLYLQLLTSYALPGAVVDTEATSRGSLSVLHRSLHLWAELGVRPFGTRLIRAEDRTSVLATIAAMGRQDPDEHLRQLAARVATELERLIQESDDNDLFKRTWP
jgi:hypothetical protein